MRKRAAFILWAAAGLCGTGFGPLACLGQSCTHIACGDSEVFTFSTTVAQVSETDISACRNERCWRGPVSSGVLTRAGHGALYLKPDAGVPGLLDCSIDTESEPGRVVFSLTWTATADAPVAVGNVLSATFNDASDSIVLRRSGTVSTFSEDYPNGKDCDKFACRTGSAKDSAD